MLNWVPEPEFGGIYAAKENGRSRSTISTSRSSPAGRARRRGNLSPAARPILRSPAPMKSSSPAARRGCGAFFATYQTCPQGIMVHASRGLKEIGDVFKSGTVAMEPGLAYVNFLKNKYGFGNREMVAYDGGPGNFLTNKDFAQQCFITSEPLAAKKPGSDPQVFLIADAGTILTPPSSLRPEKS